MLRLLKRAGKDDIVGTIWAIDWTVAWLALRRHNGLALKATDAAAKDEV